MYFSIIIPVYNRPDEINELLESLLLSTYQSNYEIVIVEDGSTITCKDVVQKYSDKLSISYYFKTNSGPGDSRNFGMKKAKGDYFIIFDSDCIIPNNYLSEVEKQLNSNFVDCFGGPDIALKSFSNVQKAINFAMTSFLTTGGIRGGSEKINKFQPRSFNMGISRKAFETSNGFGNIHPGEDPDLSIRLWKLGFETRLFTSAFVYHKRRIDWKKFSNQVSKFGKARPILNNWYPEYKKLTYWFPSLFVIGFFVSILLLFLLFDWALKLYFLYFIIVFIVSSIENRNPIIGILSIVAVWKQFFGYGLGFLESFYKINILRKKPQEAFPKLFFDIKTSQENIEETLIIERNQEAIIEKSITQEQNFIVELPQKSTIDKDKKTIALIENFKSSIKKTIDVTTEKASTLFENVKPSVKKNVAKKIEKEVIPVQNVGNPSIEKTVIPVKNIGNSNIKKTKIIGLTGGIGSGKTTVANYIISKGIPVYVSDVEAKKVMEFSNIITQISEAFGNEIINPNNTLDREKLASIVFNKPEKLKQLNAIVHPAVKKHFENWIVINKEAPMIVKETAILFESGSYKDCDAIITVTSPLETRISRVLKRDNTTREKVLQRINNQLSDEERIERSDYVVVNENFDNTKKQVDEIINLLKNK